MYNILSYVGMSMQSELCMWTMVGLVRTIFDATLFRVNANLKQVWQMNMPPELTLPLQRALRTMISGVMLVQCFTVYVYLASYIVLLYPIFLEERPTLVLPWLLLAAIRKFLCELTSLALGLGTCLLLGPARPPCIKFVITKLACIAPSFYMWMLVFSYYNTLKVTSAFKTMWHPASVEASDPDYGLELAVRRRRTKSLKDEAQVRKSIVASFSNYGPGEDNSSDDKPDTTNLERPTLEVVAVDNELYSESSKTEEVMPPYLAPSERYLTSIGFVEDWYGYEIMVPRGDRILEQFVSMLLRISAYKASGAAECANPFLSSPSKRGIFPYSSLECSSLPGEGAETPPQVGNSKIKYSYLQEYPHIFMKKTTDSSQRVSAKLTTEMSVNLSKNMQSHSVVGLNDDPLSNDDFKQYTNSSITLYSNYGNELSVPNTETKHFSSKSVESVDNVQRMINNLKHKVTNHRATQLKHKKKKNVSESKSGSNKDDSTKPLSIKDENEDKLNVVLPEGNDLNKSTQEKKNESLN